MAIITWGPQYALDVKFVDEEHQKLVGYLNQLYDAMRAGQSKEQLGPILLGLVDYAKTHFADEEKYMQEFHYPEFLQHKQQHKMFMEKVDAFKKEFEAGSASISIDLLNFLKDWLVTHIQGTDKKYVQCFHQHGLQ